ncbi:MAG TPA: MFS transporter, partial [Candidatus Hydrogenedentes bacterium]|nr:MFS transporter [Candidatus Hydrogenedentota bacterium]
MHLKPGREFTWVEGTAVCLAMIGIQLSSEVINQWGTYFYSPSVGVGRTIYVAVGIVGWIFIAGTIWDAMTGPIVGIWSDKTKSRPGWLRILPIHGRRRPFIFWGSILMTFTAVAFWYPPVEGESTANFVYGTVLLCLHWTMFGLVLVPLNSLPPEIARSESERVRMGTFIAIGMIVGLALAAVMPGELITQLDPARTEDSLVLDLPADVAPESVDAALAAILPPNTSTETVAAEVARSTREDGGARVAFRGELIHALRTAHADAGLALALPEAAGDGYTIKTAHFSRAVALPRGDAPENADALLAEVKARALTALEGIAPPRSANGDLAGCVEENLLLRERSDGPELLFYRDLLHLLSLAAIRDAVATATPVERPREVVIALTEGSFSAVGYRRLAFVLAIFSLVFLQLPVWLVRERYDSDVVAEDQGPFLAGLADAARNRPFVVYFIAFFLFTVGFLAAQRALPYWAELGLGGDEGTVTRLML